MLYTLIVAMLSMPRYNISEVECVAGVMLRSPKTRLKVEKDHELRVSLDCHSLRL